MEKVRAVLAPALYFFLPGGWSVYGQQVWREVGVAWGWGLLGGIVLLLGGLQLMSHGMKGLAASRLEYYLQACTAHPLAGALAGALVTMLLQSSSVTTVMVVGLVNSGLLDLTRGISIIAGANVGTTVTGQIISLDLDYLVLPLAVGGVLLYGGSRFRGGKGSAGLGKVSLGSSFLFMGLQLMTYALKPLRESHLILQYLLAAGEIPARGILGGALAGFLFQSSSGVMGIIISLSLQGLVTLRAGLALMVGADLGTCVTSLLASLGTNINARRAALAHLMFNLVGCLGILPIFSWFVELLSEPSLSPARQLANAHTAYNIFNVMLIIPFINLFARLVIFFMPEGR